MVVAGYRMVGEGRYQMVVVVVGWYQKVVVGEGCYRSAEGLMYLPA